MKALVRTSILMFICQFVATVSVAQVHSDMMNADSAKHILRSSSSFSWMDGPAGLPKGAKLVVLSGDPSKEGPFTVRLMFPANYEVRPHWHPTAENITVIKGTLYMGTQEVFDKEKATRLEEGSFASMPAKHVHYAFCKSPATIQLHGMGPFAITYIKPGDDPRTSTASGGMKK